MTSTKTPALEPIIPPSGFDTGTPDEWMVDPDQPDVVMAVTYEFSQTGE